MTSEREMRKRRLDDAERWSMRYRRWAERADTKKFPDGSSVHDYWLDKAREQERVAVDLRGWPREEGYRLILELQEDLALARIARDDAIVEARRAYADRDVWREIVTTVSSDATTLAGVLRVVENTMSERDEAVAEFARIRAMTTGDPQTIYHEADELRLEVQRLRERLEFEDTSDGQSSQ